MAALIDIIDRPKQAYKQAAERKNAWVWPAVLIIISMVVSALVMSSAQSSMLSTMQSRFLAQGIPSTTARTTGVPADQQGAAPAGQQGATTGTQAGAAITGGNVRPGTTPGAFPQGAVAGTSSSPLLTIGLKLAVLVVSWLLIAGLGYLLVRLLRGKPDFGAIFTAGVLATIPFFYRNLTQLIYYLSTKRIILSQGLSFLAPTGPGVAAGGSVLSSLLANIDPFAIWFYVLLGIGLHQVGQVKGWKAALSTIIIIAALNVVRLLPTMLGLSISIPILG
ncbi:MAG: YIP1 family protein [Chloroflexi bacterium]|nr:YIP1 family protein [Chloroflexota bacterium]